MRLYLSVEYENSVCFSPSFCSVTMFLLQVVVKDFVSRAVISQFKAHTSPISALCFDPSGTLLVTASTHGSNINIFRIMPSRVQNGSGTQSYDWSSSHVHLYKLHRGMTSAVCFCLYFNLSIIIVFYVFMSGSFYFFQSR